MTTEEMIRHNVLHAINGRELAEIAERFGRTVFLPNTDLRFGIRANLQAGGWSVIEITTGLNVLLISTLYSLKEALDIAFCLDKFGRDARGFELPEKFQVGKKPVTIREWLHAAYSAKTPIIGDVYHHGQKIASFSTGYDRNMIQVHYENGYYTFAALDAEIEVR